MTSIEYVGVAQLDRASGYGPEGREFESSRPRLRDLYDTDPFFCTNRKVLRTSHCTKNCSAEDCTAVYKANVAYAPRRRRRYLQAGIFVCNSDCKDNSFVIELKTICYKLYIYIIL